jgi:hypothetical protein
MVFTCAIRKIPVVKTPEEEVRQGFLHSMIHSWGYPPSLIRVEVGLQDLLPGISLNKIPKRRLDIVAFYPSGCTLKPLLLVECKEGCISEKAKVQVRGYNYFVQAPFIVLVSKHHFECILVPNTPFREIPSYENLISILPKM